MINVCLCTSIPSLLAVALGPCARLCLSVVASRFPAGGYRRITLICGVEICASSLGCAFTKQGKARGKVVSLHMRFLVCESLA